MPILATCGPFLGSLQKLHAPYWGAQNKTWHSKGVSPGLSIGEGSSPFTWWWHFAYSCPGCCLASLPCWLWSAWCSPDHPGPLLPSSFPATWPPSAWCYSSPGLCIGLCGDPSPLFSHFLIHFSVHLYSSYIFAVLLACLYRHAYVWAGTPEPRFVDYKVYLMHITLYLLLRKASLLFPLFFIIPEATHPADIFQLLSLLT